MIAQSTPRLALFSLLLGAVFVAGIAVGVIGDRMASKAGPRVKTFIRASADMSGVLDQLELTREQRAQADSIVSHRAPRSEGLMLEMAERLRGVADSIDAELRQILTPVQRARLDSLRTREPQLMLKRKVVTPGGTTVDTVITLPRDSAKRP